MKKLLVAALAFTLSACVTDDQVKETISKNPKIIFEVIEKNPEEFIEVVNKAVQAAQEKQYEKQMTLMKSEEERDLKDPKKPELKDDRRLVGDKSSEIVVIEYADFQCPACRMAYDSLKQFKEKYKGKVQFYYKHMPLDFHKMAMPASQYFEALKMQDKSRALKFFDYVFQNQQQLADAGFLDKVARDVGANMVQLAKDIKSDQIKNLIEGDIQEFIKFGFTGTPVVILNGVALHGAQNLEGLERVLKLTKVAKDP